MHKSCSNTIPILLTARLLISDIRDLIAQKSPVILVIANIKVHYIYFLKEITVISKMVFALMIIIIFNIIGPYWL